MDRRSPLLGIVSTWSMVSSFRCERQWPRKTNMEEQASGYLANICNDIETNVDLVLCARASNRLSFHTPPTLSPHSLHFRVSS